MGNDNAPIKVFGDIESGNLLLELHGDEGNVNTFTLSPQWAMLLATKLLGAIAQHPDPKSRSLTQEIHPIKGDISHVPNAGFEVRYQLKCGLDLGMLVPEEQAKSWANLVLQSLDDSNSAPNIRH